MSAIELKNMQYQGDMPGTTYDNPGFQEVDGEKGTPPPYQVSI